MAEIIPITDIESALQAIASITEDGEGSSLGSIRGTNVYKSHFFSFLEMYVGKKIVSMEEQDTEIHFYFDGGYQMEGEDLPLIDWNNVIQGYSDDDIDKNKKELGERY